MSTSCEPNLVLSYSIDLEHASSIPHELHNQHSVHLHLLCLLETPSSILPKTLAQVNTKTKIHKICQKCLLYLSKLKIAIHQTIHQLQFIGRKQTKPINKNAQILVWDPAKQLRRSELPFCIPAMTPRHGQRYQRIPSMVDNCKIL